MSKHRKGAPPKRQSPKIMVGFCHPHDSVTPQFRKSLSGVYQYDSRSRATPWILGEWDHEASGVHIPDARCSIVDSFLAVPEAEWLWMVDADASFDVDILDRLMAVADPDERPIVGALAFGVRPVHIDGNELQPNGEGAVPLELFPTIYGFDEQTGKTGIVLDYPLDSLVLVVSTGCHCFVVHRSVLADPRWKEDNHPLPWFRTAVSNGRVVSEDQFFFLRAGSFGYPTHVHTGIKTGHVKTFVADESLYLAGRGATA